MSLMNEIAQTAPQLTPDEQAAKDALYQLGATSWQQACFGAYVDANSLQAPLSALVPVFLAFVTPKAAEAIVLRTRHRDAWARAVGRLLARQQPPRRRGLSPALAAVDASLTDESIAAIPGLADAFARLEADDSTGAICSAHTMAVLVLAHERLQITDETTRFTALRLNGASSRRARRSMCARHEMHA